MKERTYTKQWRNVREDCMLCEMEEKTEWHIETPTFVLAEKLTGGPFIVVKRHTKELTDAEWWRAQHLADLWNGGPVELDVRMGMVPDHWHAHIVTEDTDVADLQNE